MDMRKTPTLEDARGGKPEGVVMCPFCPKKILLAVSYCYCSFMNTISSVLISGVFLLTACSPSVSDEQCNDAMDELEYLYQTDQNSGEYFDSVREFVNNKCLGR
jgi:hypothetical protein